MNSQAYFEMLLRLPALEEKSVDLNWLLLMQGYVTSAHAGSENIINASRVALASACAQYPVVLVDKICDSLWNILRDRSTNDRIIVSVLEVIVFLFDAGIIHQLEDE